MRRIALLGAAALFGCASCTGASRTAPGSANAGVTRISGNEGMQSISTGSVPIAGTSVLAAPANKVWTELPGVYGSLSIPLSTVEPSNRLLGNRGLKLRRELGGVKLSRYIDCGEAQGWPSADSYDVNLSVITQLQAIDSANTRVITTVDAVARPVLFVGEYNHCETRGQIESRISSMLEDAVNH
jgi:hypothetical protein